MPPASRYHLVPKFDSTNVGLRAPEIYVFQDCVNQTPEIQRNPTRNHRRIVSIRQKTCLGFHYVFDVFFLSLGSCEISVSTIRLVISVEHNGSKMGHCWPQRDAEKGTRMWMFHDVSSRISANISRSEKKNHFLSTLGLRCCDAQFHFNNVWSE